MRPIRTLVEALHELAATGRLSEETATKLTDLTTAETYHHPTTSIAMGVTGCPRCSWRGPIERYAEHNLAEHGVRVEDYDDADESG